MTLKQKVHQQFRELINDKINRLQKVLADLKDSGANETKSTAGDKYETALAMIQIEQDNVRRQLKEMQEQKAVLEKIDPLSVAETIVNGSLVKTNQSWLYISAALGKIEIDTIKVIALSSQSPLGKNLYSLKKGDTVVMNNLNYIIESIE